MANEEHLEILKQGVEVWNEWRHENRFKFLIPDLCHADLRGQNLCGVNFSSTDFKEADLSGADLSGADFSNTSTSLRRANLVRANLSGVNFNGMNLAKANFLEVNLSSANLDQVELREANLSGANLCQTSLSSAKLLLADLSSANLEKAILWHVSLQGASLQEANLNGADLRFANLNGADFRKANLNKAILLGTQALATDFSNALFTGACLEDWHTNSSTNLDGVVCDYIYRKFAPYPNHSERLPHTGKFASGEFTKLFQEIENTIDLIFHYGINWRAFAIAFNQVNTQVLDTNQEGEIFLREYKVLGDGLIALKVTTPPGAVKANLRDELMIAYEKIANMEGELKAKNELLAPLYERLLLPSTQIHSYNSTLNIPNTQKVEGDVRLMAEAKKEYTFNAPVGSVENQGNIASSGNQNNISNAAGEAQSEMKSIQHNYAPEQKQTLAEAATEIQQLLKQLEQTNPSATEAEKIEHINDETTPKFKKRVVGALQATGEAAIDEFVLENKYLKVVKAAVKGWIKPE